MTQKHLMYLHMIINIMKQKYGAIAIYDNGAVSKYFTLVTMANTQESQVLPMFNNIWNK